MPSSKADADTHALADDLQRILSRVDCEPWLIRPDDESEDAATILIGKNAARVRGKLDSRGLSVREADVPVREGFDDLLEIRR